jgi:hypothetical protein
METPPKDATETPPGQPPKKGKGQNPKSRANLNRDVPENVDRGPDGKMKARLPEQPVVDDPSDELASMLRVLAGKAAQTPLDDAYKDVLARDPSRFMDRKRQLEAERGVANLASDADLGDETVPIGEGSGHVLDLIDDLLADADKAVQARKVKNGRCVTCGQTVSVST